MTEKKVKETDTLFEDYEKRLELKEDKKKSKQKTKNKKLKNPKELNKETSYKYFFIQTLIFLSSLTLMVILLISFINSVPTFIYKFGVSGGITEESEPIALTIFALHCGVVLYFLCTGVKLICKVLFKLTKKSGINLKNSITKKPKND